MNKIFQFITHMDARAARAVGVSVALLVVVGLVFLFGRLFFNAGAEDLGAVFQAAATHWYALPATILVYVLLSFAGAPQFVLMAATVLAFGPVYGFAYAWVATLVSSSVNFWLGRWFGADLLNRFGGDWVQRASDFVGRNGLWASAL
ncbi:MAG TPA: TVP38/TMEM64 family protein, partial [Alphaproteobacteria bacterium]|nr:TVP38/TMEM64 family protein [Alphaproteobacteria bacterium]